MDVCICEVRIFTLSRFHFNNASLYCSSVVNDRREGMELSTLIIGIGAMFGWTIGLAARHGIIPARQPVQHDNNWMQRVPEPREEAEDGMCDKYLEKYPRSPTLRVPAQVSSQAQRIKKTKIWKAFSSQMWNHIVLSWNHFSFQQWESSLPHRIYIPYQNNADDELWWMPCNPCMAWYAKFCKRSDLCLCILMT